MALWRKPLQFINVMLANRSQMSVAERGPGRMTYAKKKKTPLQNTTCASRLSVQVKKPFLQEHSRLNCTFHIIHANKLHPSSNDVGFSLTISELPKSIVVLVRPFFALLFPVLFIEAQEVPISAAELSLKNNFMQICWKFKKK